ncbi:transposable element Tcb2 transposase [Trichonephila clavipes]|nr:transposable element Tcb2 transposase [Trichonephila clavipes]
MHRIAGQVDCSELAVRNCWEQWTREEANLKSKHPFRALPLTPEHRLTASTVVASQINVTDWQKVVFSDESRFVLGTDDNRVRVWRRPGERYNSPYTVLRHTARTAGVMVWWEGIAYDSRYTFIVMCGTLTGQRYIDDILRPHVRPFLNGLPGAISSKVMLVCIQQELLKISYVIFRLFHGRPTPRFVPCRAWVGSAKTADAIVSLCT